MKNNRAEFLAIYESLYAEYNAIENEKMAEAKKAFWIEGDPTISKALFLAHGYMGSPNEMKYIAAPFIEAGYSVIGFLIPGHGASSKVANAFTKERWRSEMKRQFELVLESFTHVQAVGFSTGGLLLQDYIIHQPLPPSLKSLHLISPYFIQRIGSFLNPVDGIIQKFFNNISLDLAFAVSRFPDLAVMRIDRESYNQNIPVQVAREIKELGLEIYNLKAADKKIHLPTQLFLTENDWTVKTEASKQVISRHIENDLIELIWYPGQEPHHLMAPSVSKVAENIQKRLFNFNAI